MRSPVVTSPCSIAQPSAARRLSCSTPSGLSVGNCVVWWGVLAPSGTPPAVVDRLSAELAKIVASAEMRRRMQDMELEPFSLSGSQFGAFIRSEYPFWQQFLINSGIKLD